MSTRTNLKPHTVVEDGDMSANITSEPTLLQSLSRISYAITWDGSSPEGDISIQVSNDYALSPDGQNVANAGTWNTLTLAYNGSATTTVPVSGDTGSGFIDIEGTAAYAARLVYLFTSGTGSLNVVVAGKVS